MERPRPKSKATEPSTADRPATLSALAGLIAECPPAWRDGFSARLRGLRRRASAGKPFERGRRALAADVKRVMARRDGRLSADLRPGFDLDLPIIDRREEIAAAISAHQVVVICGETGSGKSTQLPKICLALGRGIDGIIGHTQPRRIAARSLAARIAEECGTETGQGVGYKIRFSDHASPRTRVKLVTDGMLLAETQGDPDLAEYDTLIIDEAHERSLNIDFLLGYLKNLLPRRPDLKVIITSATIDPERFSRHFNDAPVIEVSGRTYPVEVRYRPPADGGEDERDRSLQAGILDAVDELAGEGPGDVLVFLPGERDIREAAERLRKHHPPQTEILPLYGRLSATEQQRVFAPHGQRRIVLATNVAETSLTVPGIRYVVDTGLARLSRYSYRTKVQRLPVERISQASASQRAGRCGRIAPGVCIRLYGEEDFQSRPEFTDPEILRTNLAAVILQMKYLRLGGIEDFPFVEPPDPRYVRDGLKLLHELHAVDEKGGLTDLGRRLARLPVDPRIGRMLIAAHDERCLTEVLVIAAALSIQDPRERPMDAQAAADQAHARWRDDRSDFGALLQLWAAYHDAARHRSQRKLREWCREHYLSWLRLREWRDIHRQLRELVKGMGFRENEQPAESMPLHRALLTGLLSNIALRTADSEYTGPRGLTLAIFPGSGLAKRRPKWIVAAELVETSRVFARTVAEVRPEWIEPLAAHLIGRHHYEPFWEEKTGRVAGFEDVTLYGLPLASRRRINYARVAPGEAREVFIREALVRGRFRSRGRCLEHNGRIISELEKLEAKSRRRDVLVDENVLFDFYAERIPPAVTDGPSFERWVSKPDNDRALFVTRELLMARKALDVTRADYPDHLSVGGLRLPLAYHFEPGHPEDGVTAVVPLAALNQLPAEPFEWLVPGLLEEKVTTLIRALPKSLRKNFVPAPDFAAAVLSAASHGQDSLTEAVRRELRRMTGVDVPLDAWDRVELPAHLTMGFRVVDSDGRAVSCGRDLRALQQELAGRSEAQFSSAESGQYERSGLRHWEVGDLAEHVELEQGGVQLRGYPALVDEGESVALRLLDAPDRAATAHRAGVRRLLMLALSQQTRYLRRQLPDIERLCLLYNAIGSCDELREDILVAVFDRVFLAHGVPRSEPEFRRLLEAGRGALVPAATALAATLKSVLEAHRAVRKRLRGEVPLPQMDACRDLAEQLDELVYPGFVQATPPERLPELPRYLDAMARRLDRLQRQPDKDAAGHGIIRPLWERYLQRREQHRSKHIDDPALSRYRWLLEEYRVSLFAQELGTKEKVSGKRLAEAWESVR